MGTELWTRIADEEGWVRGPIIGAGASGTVSLAMSRSNGELFAVKSTANCSLALENEYHILRSLNSPFIVRCLGRDKSFENGVAVHNLFMEYMPGGSIADLLTKFGGRLDESVIRVYTHGILHGIHYHHRQGIVHCDVKGKNVLVSANGVKLADFGSAKRIGDEGKGREPLQFRGTLLWMAPEVLNQVEQGPASDIWSLGCTVLEMATGRHPWSQVSNPLAAMYRIGCTEELPEFPASLSPQIRDFLEKCLQRDPKKRWTSGELLNHPFLNKGLSTMKEEKAIRAPLSPTSNLDFGNQVWDSYSSQTTPLLSLNIPCPARGCNADADTKRSIHQCPKPSPRDRVMALATASVADRPNWLASPPGQWIVVRSSKDNLPAPEKLLSTSDIIDSSAIQELIYREKDCTSGSRASNWEELQPGDEQYKCSESTVCVAQTPQESSSSTSAETLRLGFFSLSMTPHLIDGTSEFYENSFQSIAGGDIGIHNRSVSGQPFYTYDVKWSSTTVKGAACCLCCMCTRHFCHRSVTKGQLYCTVDTSYNFYTESIPIEFIGLHRIPLLLLFFFSSAYHHITSGTINRHHIFVSQFGGISAMHLGDNLTFQVPEGRGLNFDAQKTKKYLSSEVN